MQPAVPDRQQLIELANTRMPYGRYEGRLLIELPEPYLAWYAQKGFPPGKIGAQLQLMYEIKANGLEKVIWPLVKQ
ncbi:MAG: DUF3820 family protein [Salinivirgaceae bacterium]|nr:DUF3820 family protein [Salinivirgaceae bacterium]